MSLRLHAVFWLTIFTLTLGTTPASARRKSTRKQTPVKVRHITVIRENIFNPRRAGESSWPYRTLNALHTRTRESVIRTFLLFKEGDLYKPSLGRESERNLRRYLPLRAARVSATPVGPSFVDITVRTQDTWSTQPTASISGSGGKTNTRLGLKETNLFGRGIAAQANYKNNDGIITRTFAFDQPTLGRTHWDLKGLYSQGEDGDLREISLGHPFFSSLTPWGAGASLTSDRTVTRVFHDGKESSLYRSRLFDASAFAAASWGSTTELARRVGVGFRYFKDGLREELSGSALKDDLYKIPTLFFQWEEQDFITTSRVRRYDQDEDFNLGTALILKPGLSKRLWFPHSDSAAFLDATLSRGWPHGADRFTLGTFSWEGRQKDGAWRDTTVKARLESYHRLHSRVTLAGQLRAEKLLNPSPDLRLSLGGDKGLRGYEVNQFNGTRLALANVEGRYFLWDDILRVAALGAATFADVGTVWDEKEKIKFRDLRPDVGAGLRVYLTRTSIGNVLRFDVGYALHPTPGQKNLLFTFASEQAF